MTLSRRPDKLMEGSWKLWPTNLSPAKWDIYELKPKEILTETCTYDLYRVSYSRYDGQYKWLYKPRGLGKFMW